jgi:cob(I)alamin adenosyltransferase
MKAGDHAADRLTLAGRVQIYTGSGKGKTTAALGQAVRAAGHGLRTYVGQFMKGRPYGEIDALRRLPLITIEQYGGPDCLRREEVTADDVARAKRGLARALEAMSSGRYDLVVLDEVNVAVWFDLLDTEEVLAFIDRRPEHVELILTGRYAPAAVVEKADLVTDMREVKHYYREGVQARDGIER